MSFPSIGSYNHQFLSMGNVLPGALRAAQLCLLTLALGAGCGSPTAPTPPEPPPPPSPPPVAEAPTLSCAEGVSRSTVNATGLEINFDTPTAANGEGSVTVSCSPASGATFPIGVTQVNCTATDSLSRTGTCSFNVTVSRLSTISRTTYLAFGDSITAGEVTVPVGTIVIGPGSVTRQVVVPQAAWPAVVLRTLQGRYSSQSNSFTVANHGLSGEQAIYARSRFISSLNTVRPEVVMFLHGHNDISGGRDGAASGAASEIEAMAAEARGRGIRMFIGTVLPARTSGNKHILPAFIDDFNRRLEIVASRQSATIVDTYAALVTDVNRYIGIDGLHPTEAGYAKIADAFFQAIQNAYEVQ